MLLLQSFVSSFRAIITFDDDDDVDDNDEPSPNKHIVFFVR